MSASPARDAVPYGPLMFLAALGAGGLAVSFFMIPMFWVPHPGQPVPVFEDILAAFRTGGPALQAAIAVALAGIAFFAATHVRLLVWNLRRFAAFRRSPAHAALLAGNGATQLMAVPLALAMAINAAFIVGLVFVPRLWSVVEYLFPLALAAFTLVGAYALRLYGGVLGSVLTRGLDCAKNNSLAQMLPAFAFAMIAVGLAAPASLSATPATVAVSLMLSTAFMLLAIVQGLVALVLGIRSILENGLAVEGAPTLMVGVPILTVLGIGWLRQQHGLHVHFDVHAGAGEAFMMLGGILSAQLLILAAGWGALRRTVYAARILTGPDRSAGSLALLCPLVAVSVMGHFFINKGLVATGLVAKFGIAYWTASALPVIVQLVAVWLFFRLLSRLMRPTPAPLPGATAAA